MGVKSIRKTGRTFSMNSNEFEIEFEDGSKQTIWSPVWNEYTDEEEWELAEQKAQEIANTKPIYKECGWGRCNYDQYMYKGKTE